MTTQTTDYEAACARATTEQGLDPVLDAIRREGIEIVAEQTGGFCMVATAYVNRIKTRYIGITTEAGLRNDDGDDLYLVARYTPEEPDGVTITTACPLAGLAGVVRDQYEKAQGRYRVVTQAGPHGWFSSLVHDTGENGGAVMGSWAKREDAEIFADELNAELTPECEVCGRRGHNCNSCPHP